MVQRAEKRLLRERKRGKETERVNGRKKHGLIRRRSLDRRDKKKELPDKGHVKMGWGMDRF